MELSKSVIKKLERMAINKFCLVPWSLEQPLAKFPKFPRKTLTWRSFLTKNCWWPDSVREFSPGKFTKFSELLL